MRALKAVFFVGLLMWAALSAGNFLDRRLKRVDELTPALRVLLKKREEDKQEMQENVLSNVKELVLPYLVRLKRGKLEPHQETLMEILQSNLDNIISPFISKISSRYLSFTPTEIRVANLVKEGKTNKEIAEKLHLSPYTVKQYTLSIYKKLDVNGRRQAVARAAELGIL